MRAGYDEDFFADEKFVVKDLRQRAERDSFVEYALEFDVAARKRVPDYDQVGPRVEIGLGEGLRYGNSERL